MNAGLIEVTNILIRIFISFRTDNDDVDSNGVRSLQHSPEVIASNFSTQPSTNLSLMHSNYMGHFQSIDDVVNAADILSRTDVVLKEYRVRDLSLGIICTECEEIICVVHSLTYCQRSG